ncbi:MAG: hypothetical protein GF317_21820 [Candidatus Lokiarchaeota archaeon]|nr:hypothetical protein [Candidatus Lokiarchaeota archaeon]MBD3202100.1 hypothetical protein [Candidatus Lokiarchaeota archaeon]
MEGSRYFLWGYTAYISYHTDDGKNLYLNSIHFLLNPSGTDLIPGFELFIIIGLTCIIGLGVIIPRMKKYDTMIPTNT